MEAIEIDREQSSLKGDGLISLGSIELDKTVWNRGSLGREQFLEKLAHDLTFGMWA